MSRSDDTTPAGRHPGSGDRARPEGSVVVTRAAGRTRSLPPAGGLVIAGIAGIAVVIGGVAAVSLAGPLLDRVVVGEPVRPAATLDATAAPVAATAPGGEASAAASSAPGEAAAARTVQGTTRLGLLGPQPLLDTRDSSPLAPGAEAAVPLPALPSGATAVLVEVSLQDAATAGAVTVAAGDVTLPVLRAAGPGAQTSATVTVPVPPSATLTVRSEGGGHLVLTLVGAFEPAESATAGRVVPVPATRVADLVPETDGHVATVDLAAVPELGDAALGAVMLQFSADVGERGGSVSAGPSPGDLPQEVLWAATTGDDRVRGGFLVVPVSDTGSVTIEYRAGREIRVDVVGYVTSDAAPESADGLVVPVTAPAALPPIEVAAGAGVDVPVVPADGGVPADRVTGVLLGVSGEGTAEGAVGVHSPVESPPGAGTVSVTRAGPRSVLTLAGVDGGAVRVSGDAGATITLTPQALVVSEG
jgi:hypothetical protein